MQFPSSSSQPSTSSENVSGGVPPLPSLPSLDDDPDESDVIFVKQDPDNPEVQQGKSKGKGKGASAEERHAEQIQVNNFLHIDQIALISGLKVYNFGFSLG